MKKVTLNIRNAGEITINPYSATFEADNLPKAVGQAIYDAHMKLAGNKQWDAPVITINDIELTSAEVKKVRGSFINFQVDFAMVRESILGQLAFTSEDAGVEYIRHTDRNKVYAKQKSFTTQQIAAQAKEQMRLTRDLTRWVKEDAKASVVPPEVQKRREVLAEAARQKRIAAKSSTK